MTSLTVLKKNRKSNFEKLIKRIENMSKSYSDPDDRYWYPERDKAGNAYAVIRFLPPAPNEDVPYVLVRSYAFKGPGGWYIENSRLTLREEDPVANLNSKLWSSGIEKNKEIARSRRLRNTFHSNIYVVKDPANPENEGKVFLFAYGKKIFAKIKDCAHPEFADEQPFDPFDFWEGADFKLKIRQVEGYPNYDKSEFAEQSPIKDSAGNELSEEEIEKIWNSQHSLNDIIDPKNFKSYAELEAKMNKVLNIGDNVSGFTIEENEEADDNEIDVHEFSSKETFDDSNLSDEDEDTLEFFKKLANE